MEKDYVIKLKKKCKWCWLLLLLLLPLVLLIPLKRDIKIKLVNCYNNSILTNKEVSFEYIKRDLFSFDTKKIFTRDTFPIPILTDTTDQNGIVVFKDVKYSVYQWIFRKNDWGRAFSYQTCFSADSTYNFFKLNKKKETILCSYPTLKDFEFTVVDIDDNNEPLENATVVLESDLFNYKETIQSHNDGTVVFEDVPFCSNITVVGSKYGWYDTSIVGYAQNIYQVEDTLFLRQEKVIVKFFVQDLNTKISLVNADAHLFFKDDQNQVGQEMTSNINGVIKGVFEEVHKIKEINIEVNTNPNLAAYYDTSTVETIGYIVVEDWVNRPDEDKIIYLRPRPQPLILKDVDCINNTGLAGIKNYVIIKKANGRVDTILAESNANGEFNLSAGAGDVISVIARSDAPCPNKRIDNDYTIVDVTFEDLQNDANLRKIPLCRENPPQLQFRDIDQTTGEGISGVVNTIKLRNGRTYTKISGSDGWFTIDDVYECEIISIEADGSPVDYGSNNSKIKDDNYGDLINAPQSERDIPLVKNPPPPPPLPPNVKPCVGASSGGAGITENIHSLEGCDNFTITYDMRGTYPDEMIVYCGQGNNKTQIWSTNGPVLNTGTITLNCSSSEITIVVIGDNNNGTEWDYDLNCNCN